ncbi:hypothetical protein [Neokomagataea anthophila]|uniref:Uncharacterized protein n=1 Tax=Neokomagataea anthophila TaxID=2826925 RepID=A0ABS5E984_9PROT|nr:hypothetical protein [Neokomagataea anthophila]MBR0560078.1 hypothetical protein [Neokomagataea anthophila]
MLKTANARGASNALHSLSEQIEQTRHLEGFARSSRNLSDSPLMWKVWENNRQGHAERLEALVRQWRQEVARQRVPFIARILGLV